MCNWYAMCDIEPVGVVQHPILGLVPTCQRCAGKHSLVFETDESAARGSDQDKAQQRVHYNTNLTLLAHHGTVADLKAELRKEIADYRLDIDPDNVDYAALVRYIISA